MSTPSHLAFRILGFLSPVLVWLCLENFLLPRELFAFRPWDVLVVNFLPASQLGPFMNGVSLDMVSTGYQDYMLRRPQPKKKRERFSVDRHGFRNPDRPSPSRGYEVVLHGDSNFAGSFLDEPDTLGRVLERQLGRTVYTVSNDVVWMEDNVMTAHPPRYFVAQFYPDLDPRATRTWRFTFDRFETRPARRLPVAVLIAWERFCKQPARNWIRARLGLTELPNQSGAFAGLGVEARRQAAETEEEALVKLGDQAERLHAKMKKDGTTCIFLFMPAPPERYQKYLPLLARLRKNGYPVVDFLPTAEYPLGYPGDFWQTADSHWTEKAVRATSEKIRERIHQLEQERSSSRP